MAISVNNLAPRVVALAVVGFCVWPSISDLLSTTETKPPQPPEELAASLLKPKLPPALKRSPFGGALKGPESSGDNALAKGGAPGQKGDATKKGGATKSKEAAMGGALLAELSLDGTSIAGDQSFAVINGRVFSNGDSIAELIPITPPFKIVNIAPYKVVLEREGKLAELTYSNTPSKSTLSGAGAKPGDKGGAKKPRLTLTGSSGKRP